MMEAKQLARYDALIHWCAAQRRLAVAYSGGVDSTLLAKAAFDALGDNALALTARAEMVSERERYDATSFAQAIGIRHIWVDIDLRGIPHFFDNQRDRCYDCKKALMSALLARAAQENISVLTEAGNIDDLDDIRPGTRAIMELGIKSPFVALQFGKTEIRALSRSLGLPSADKPSFACLASRVPFGEKISIPKLKTIEAAESFLFSMGFSQLRVRHHGEIARIEIDEDEMPKALSLRKQIESYLSSLGFSFVTLDLGGFTSGRMNTVESGLYSNSMNDS